MLLVFVPVAARAADEALLLDVWVNSFALNKVGQFVLRDGKLLARSAELTALGFKLAGAAPAADGLIPLSNLPGLKWRLDAQAAVLYITIGNADLVPAQVDTGRPVSTSHAIESGTGTTLNYDITGTHAGKRDVAAGLLDWRVFSPWGVASSGFLAYVGGGPRGPGTDSLVRLDSSYAFADTDSGRRYYLGDFINGGLAWTRPVRLGGVQITSDYSTRPDLITFPLPSVGGVAAVPSTLDVLVNGSRFLSEAVNPGPFEIPQLPVVTGAGNISLVLTNALGRQVTVNMPFYASSAMLAPGFQTWSAQAGLLRRNYGSVSNDYGRPAGSFTWRRGVASWLTLEASGEGTEGVPGRNGGSVAMAGGGAVVNLGNVAVLNVAAAGSDGTHGSGSQFSAGLQRIGRILSLSLSATAASRLYRDIAAANNDPVPRLQLNASAGLSLGRFGSVGVAYASIDSVAPGPAGTSSQVDAALSQDNPPLGGFTDAPTTSHAHVASASYTVQIGPASIYTTAFKDFSHGGGNGVLAGFTIPLGRRSSVNTSGGAGSGGRDVQVQATQSPVVIGDFGYQLFGSAANADHEFAQLSYKSPWALVTAGVDRTAGENTFSLETQGAVSYADGAVFASNTINDSFAVVDTNGLAGVHVLSENREAGVTDSGGVVLVPDLRSFDANHIAIVPTDVPLDTSIGETERVIRPQDRSGVVVTFAVHVSHGALLSLVDRAGVAVPVGSAATLQSSGVAAPIGYDGQAYIEDLKRHNTIHVVLANGNRCHAAFDYKPVKGQVPTIGPVRCLEDAQ